MATESGKRPKRLGKGLSAMVNPSPVQADLHDSPIISLPSDVSEFVGLARIPIARIEQSPYQPRASFVEADLEQLAESIKHAGVIQPIVVRRSNRTASMYELIAGERRWRAAQMAGLDAIPSVVVSISDHEAAEWSLIENLQRKDLNAMERANALRRLCDLFELTHHEAAERVGLDRSTVANLIRVTELAEPIQALIAAGELTIGHGKALLAIADLDLRLRLAKRAAAEQWPVRRLEQTDGTQPTASHESNARVASPTLVDLERRLSEHLGTRVRITTTRNGTRGKLSMEFYTLDHFDGLMSKFGFMGHET